MSRGWTTSYLRLGVGLLLNGLLLNGLLLSQSCSAAEATAGSPGDRPPISYVQDILPIFRARCQGCHQAANHKGNYDMTSFESLLRGGESGEAAVQPGKPTESYLIQQITPDATGAAAMPQGKPALTAPEIALITQWITEGARDDAPGERPRFDAEHPPTYERQPVVTSLAVSPDGKLLAVAGHHEVLLHAPDGTGLQGRLVGLSERIEAVRFSPDGTQLAVAGGLPGRMGEIQIWNVAERQLHLSLPVGGDTLYGANWSPDGKLVSFGCADHSVRVIEAATGREVLFQGAHDDWPLDTTFSLDGSHLVSAGRDRAVKLIEVATQRFVDNITSITPGVLKGGISAVQRHPQRDEIAVASADGIPKVYGLFRQSKRVIGDDANLRREFPAMPGRVMSVAYSHDGGWLGCASSDLTVGEVSVFSYPQVDQVPDAIKAIQETVVTSRTADQNAQLSAYHQAGVVRISQVKFPEGMYAVAFHPQTKELFAAGLDGIIRVLDAAQGKVLREFSAAPLPVASAPRANTMALQFPEEPFAPEKAPSDADVRKIRIEPSDVTLTSPRDYVQLLVTAELSDGSLRDVTRVVTWQQVPSTLRISPRGRLTATGDGTRSEQLTPVTAVLGSLQAPLTVHLQGALASESPTAQGIAINMEQDVMPVLSRVGCNQGTCHGAKDGKNGFKLSLRGYDGLFDARALSDELKGRRVSRAAADDSLFLLKASGRVAHVGGQLTRPGEPYYEVLRQWVQEGARHQVATNPVVGITIQPAAPVVPKIGDTQQMRIIATFQNGAQKDVTYEAFVDSGNTEVAKVDSSGLVTTVRRGEAPMLARYQGNYAVATLTVMGERSDFQWLDTPTLGRIDELVDQKLQRMKILPSQLCSDAEFLRRVYLDLTGLPPTIQEVEQFLADGRPSRDKRNQMVDLLVGSDAFIDFWTNKWCDLLMVNSKFLGSEGAIMYRDWVRGQIADNVPYDEFARQIITANGSNRTNPAAGYYKILREPPEIMENTTQLFMAVRFNCNKCHDHPFERWTQDQYYQTAAYFARVGLQKDEASGDRRIGGSAVESAKPLFEVVYEKEAGEVIHDRTQLATAPQFPFPCDYTAPASGERRAEFAAWLTSPDNPYFARSYVNRLWGYLLGVGIIEPIDDIRAGNPPSNPELLDYLTRQLVDHGFDTQALFREICKSATYQRSVQSSPWNEDDRTNYSHALPRRLPAEVLFDTLHRVVGSVPHIPGVPAGTRASQLPDAAIELPSGFLASFGRPARESSCECERSTGLQLGPVMALVTGPTVGTLLSDPKNKIAELVKSNPDDRAVVREIFLRVLGRPPESAEIDTALATMQQVVTDHAQLLDQVAQRKVIAERLHGEQQAERDQALATLEQRLAAHREAQAPARAQQESERQRLLTAAQAELAQLDQGLAGAAPSWEQQLKASKSAWERLSPVSPEVPAGATVQILEDQSIYLAGSAATGVWGVQATVPQGKGVTGIRLELMPDPRLPQEGPGRGAQGGWEIAEVSLQKVIADQAPNQAPQAVPLQQPMVSYSDEGHDAAGLVDGNAMPGATGWRVVRPQALPHVAIFSLPANWTDEQPVTLRLAVHCTDANALPGRIRWSVTREAQPLGPAVPWTIRTLLDLPADQRSEAQRQTLHHYHQQTDRAYRAQHLVVEERLKPLPADPQAVALEQELQQLRQKPLAGDPLYDSLQRDLAMSQTQVENLRLTAAQDLVWALINTPSFLFNR